MRSDDRDFRKMGSPLGCPPVLLLQLLLQSRLFVPGILAISLILSSQRIPRDHLVKRTETHLYLAKFMIPLKWCRRRPPSGRVRSEMVKLRIPHVSARVRLFRQLYVAQQIVDSED